MSRWTIGGITAGFVLGLCAAACAHAPDPDGMPTIVSVAQSVLEVRIGDNPSVDEAVIDSWVERSGQMVVNYFGRFPVQKLKVDIVTGGYGALGYGQHFWGKRIEIHAGRHTSPLDISKDWVMLHEMMHTAFPRLQGGHRWMREGLSTYLESAVRAQHGIVTVDSVWERWLGSMPNGMLPAGDRGLDRAHSWGALYWGGALYWMIADVRIRAESGGRYTLQDALSAILAQGGNSLRRWPLRRVLKVGDAATHTAVLRTLYRQMGTRFFRFDLDVFFGKLGVSRGPDDEVVYDQAAPLAKLRSRMYQPRYVLAPLVGLTG